MWDCCGGAEAATERIKEGILVLLRWILKSEFRVPCELLCESQVFQLRLIITPVLADLDPQFQENLDAKQ